jgi:hypothetical protein
LRNRTRCRERGYKNSGRCQFSNERHIQIFCTAGGIDCMLT